jgi:5-methylcytosine-specific restriction endonuclease McrA
MTFKNEWPTYPEHLQKSTDKVDTPVLFSTLVLTCHICKSQKTVQLDVYTDVTNFAKTRYYCKDCTVDKRFDYEKEHNAEYDARFLDPVFMKKYKKLNPHKAKESYMRRLMLKVQAPGNYSYDAWIAKVNYYGWKCVYCDKSLDIDTLTCDHFKPLSKKGTNFISNLVPACLSCNCRKKAKLDWEIRYRPKNG